MTQSQIIERKIFLYNQYIEIVQEEYNDKIMVLEKELRELNKKG